MGEVVQSQKAFEIVTKSESQPSADLIWAPQTTIQSSCQNMQGEETPPQTVPHTKQTPRSR